MSTVSVEAPEWDLHDLADALGELKAFQPLAHPSMIDGYLAALALLPRLPDPVQWQRYLMDESGDPAAQRAWQKLKWPVGITHPFAPALARLEEWQQAVSRRSWIDPWVLADEEESEDWTDASLAWERFPQVQDWVIGFASACSHWGETIEGQEPERLEAMALLFQYLSAQDLEDAQSLLEVIGELAPPESLEEAVETLVRGCYLLADLAPAREAPRRPKNGRPVR